MSKHDWARLDAYSRRVRTVNYTSSSDPHSGLSTRTLLVLSQLCPAPLLPSLRALHCTALQHWDDGALLTIGPNLREVDIEYHSTKDGCSELLLTTLAAKSPALTRLALRTGFGTTALPYLTQFVALHALDVMDIGELATREVQLHLSGLPSLVELAVALPSTATALLAHPQSHSLPPYRLQLPIRTPSALRSHSGGTGTSTPVTTQFPALRRLTVSGDLLLISSLLAQMSTQHMERLIVIITAASGAAENYVWTAFLTDINRKWASSLRRLAVTTHSPLTQHTPVPSTHVTGEPLTSFLPMPSTWRNITAIHLPPPSSAQGSGHRFSVCAGLRFFADECPKLLDLRLAVSTTGLLPTEPAPAPVSPEHGLATLVVFSSPVTLGDTAVVARHLDSLFPNLKTVRAVPGYPAADVENWKHVESLVSMCQRVREADRQRRRDVPPPTQELGSPVAVRVQSGVVTGQKPPSTRPMVMLKDGASSQPKTMLPQSTPFTFSFATPSNVNSSPQFTPPS